MVQRFIKTFGYNVVIAFGATTGFHSLPGRPSAPTNGILRAFDRARQSIIAQLAAKDKKDGTHTDTRGVLLIVTTPEHFTTQACFRCGSKLEESETHKRKKCKVRVLPAVHRPIAHIPSRRRHPRRVPRRQCRRWWQ